MTQPVFGAGGKDSIGRNWGVNKLELPEGVDIRLFRRNASPGSNIQETTLTAWGITAPLTMTAGVGEGAVTYTVWPEQVTLSMTEEGVQHERGVSDPEEAATGGETLPTNDAVEYDAFFIMRMRCTLSVSGRVSAIADGIDPSTLPWPQNITSAIGDLDVGLDTVEGEGKLLLNNADYNKVNTDWGNFSYAYEFIVPATAPFTANMISTAGLTLPSGYKHLLTKNLSLSVGDFARATISAQGFKTYVPAP